MRGHLRVAEQPVQQIEVAGGPRLDADLGRFAHLARLPAAPAPARYDRPMSSDHATVAEEEYLQTIFWLHEAGLPMTGANVARAMQLSPPTVHEMVGRLERDGYITRGDDKVDLVHRERARARRGRSSAATG